MLVLKIGNFALFLVIISLPNFNGIPVEEDLTLSFEEKQALDKFKELVAGSLPHDFMKTEIYLIKWLRHAKLDLQTAQQMLKDHITWRNEMRLDGILDEDFSYLEQEFPLDVSGQDKEGRPLLAIDVSALDVRRQVISGKREETTRFIWRAVESQCKKIRDKQARGERVTQMVIIFDLKGYNLIQHGCLNCLPIYINFLRNYRLQYPLMADKLIFVNTPAVFETILDLLDLRKRAVVKVFSGPKEEWQRYLNSIISYDQLPEFLGGNRTASAFD